MEEFRVAVTVFVTTEAVSQRDAARIAERAVEEALDRSAVPSAINACVLECRTRGSHARVFTVRVHKVAEVGWAAQGSLLRVEPTGQAYREYEYSKLSCRCGHRLDAHGRVCPNCDCTDPRPLERVDPGQSEV